MKKVFGILVITIVFTTVFYNNCEGWNVNKAIVDSTNNPSSDPNANSPNPTPMNPPPAGTTVSEKAMNLLVQQCSLCHGPTTKLGTIPFDVTSWDSLVTTTNVVVPNNLMGSILYTRMLDTAAPMPTTGKLPDDQIKIVADWIMAGAPKPGATTPPPVVDTFDPAKTPKTYENVKKFILAGKCIGCHGPVTAKSNVRYDTYTATLRDLDGLVSEIERDTMPPKKDRTQYPAVTAVELKFIKDWIALGSPEK